MTKLDHRALRQGGAVALVFAVPFSVGAQWFPVLVLLALGGFVLGAGVAAWVQRTGFPLLHGMVCAGATYLAAQAVFVVVKLVRGGDVNWLGVVFTFSATLLAGLIGGGLGSTLQRQGFVPGQRRPR